MDCTLAHILICLPPNRLPQSYSQYFSPAYDLPTLPSELWNIIFFMTTTITSPPTDDFLSASDPGCPCDLGLYMKSMRDKKALCLVNKEWNWRAQAVLYEFVWIRRSSQAKLLANTLQCQSTGPSSTTSGPHIRRLHISTKALERCAVEDIRTILDFAPNLVTYSDHHSVRRNRFDYALNPNPRCSPKELFEVLAHPENKLKKLSWTHYPEEEGENFPFHITPVLQRTVTSSVLEYLELCSENFCIGLSMGGGGGINKELLMNTMVTLPALRSLKVTLDNTTFSVLSAWDMPLLINLSVVSSDFSYASIGFSRFFLAHGAKLRQLELGHSSSLISEHYLTSPPFHHHLTPHRLPPLAKWCPNLTTFICSADSEWNWQTPDFIAPHILLPSHPNVTLIGIRDIDKRMRYDVQGSPWGGNTQDDAPFFGLVEWVGSLVGREMFPSLQFMRDLSRGSALMRGAWAAPLLFSEDDDDEDNKEEEDRPIVEARVLKFWDKVLTKCYDRGVWLEDWRGVNVTRADLKRGWKVLNDGLGFGEDGTF